MDYGKFWHAIFIILLVWAWNGLWHNGRTEETVRVTKKKTQLILNKFTVDENVEINVKTYT